ncbi:MAG TPA: 2Fe-2S iron-sulfur cluster-binding protein [Gammaproteobacteria bacterium]
MGQIIVTDLAGQTHTVEADDSMSVMENLFDAGIPIKAACFGCCSCSTCHVYVDEEWQDKLEPRGREEEEILDMVVEYRPNSRLCCQIPYNESLDGLKVTLAVDTKPD